MNSTHLGEGKQPVVSAEWRGTGDRVGAALGSSELPAVTQHLLASHVNDHLKAGPAAPSRSAPADAMKIRRQLSLQSPVQIFYDVL